MDSDSSDGTYDAIAKRLPELRQRYLRVTLVKRDFGFRLPQGTARWQPWLQIPRRSVLAKSRNHLLFAALRDEQWVLWLDVDLASYPTGVVERLLATGRDLVAPHCVTRSWWSGDDNFTRRTVRMDGLRDGPELVRLDAVGATMLLVRADVHRDGLVFPAFPYGAASRLASDQPVPPERIWEPESEGLALMAKDMGYECWGMPRLEVVHPNE